MGPNDIKGDIYDVMTNSRELTNYCQESVKSKYSKKISDSLNNFHLKSAIDFITKSLTDEERLFFSSNEIDLDNTTELVNKPIYNKVIDYTSKYLINYH
tara:strand:- start:264 stop:560 length:297 start_codon:yes stop_codon:yes gene_type:complete